MKHTSKRIIALALTAFMLMSAVACSRGKTASETVHAHNAEVQGVAAEIDLASGSNSSRNMDSGFYTEDIAGADYENLQSAAEPTTANAGGSSTGSVSVSDPVVTDRMLIRYVTVSCETLNFTDMVSSIESQVGALGGYIESKSYYGTGNAGDLRHASYTIRVSSAALDQLVNQIGNCAIITNTNESTEDVTLSYTDMQARVESLRIEQETLNELLAQADSLETILILQDELTNIRYQIESYESQMRVLENLSTYSTLTLNIDEVLEETPVEEAHVKTYSERFSEAFHDGLDSAKKSCEDLGLYIAENCISLAIRLVFFIIAVIVITVVVKKIRKNNKAKREAITSIVGSSSSSTAASASTTPIAKEDAKNAEPDNK
ncbi:MAG: DUF4349 domain-containing protein [Clostridiales bacterium]|nr:DUF4349 domain-containing protein [Clostridiales bacterium]